VAVFVHLWGPAGLPSLAQRPVWSVWALIGVWLLLSAAAAWASARGVSQLKLSVTVTNGSAQRLYERCGFTPYGRDPRVIRVGDTYYDELLMVRRLDAADATL
jgi:RimJ/RimL family protein N-acetyltransferase